jgi:HK97 family phage major capsid protein
MASDIIRSLRDDLAILDLVRIYPCPNAQSLGIPSMIDAGDPTWTAELAIGSEDSTMSFGKRELFPHPVAQFIKVSNKLLRASTMNPEGLVTESLRYKMGIVIENALLNGTGSGQPLGLFTASDQAISTSRDVSTGNTTTSITADGLIEAKYALRSAYLRSKNLRWIFHRDAVKQIRKLKDGEGQYLWRAGLANDEQDTVLDVGYVVSEYAPNTFTTGQYVGLIGDLRFYAVAVAMNMGIQRLQELYAVTNQTGFIIRAELDGMPTLEEAFVRVKLA